MAGNEVANQDNRKPAAAVTFRPGTAADSYAVFYLFEETLADLMRRTGSDTPTSIADPQALASMWQERQRLYEHLAQTAEAFVIAETNGRIIGFSRSILRDGVRQLTELFVLPGQQSGGVGRELLRRAFPADGARRRSIIASPDVRAQTLYLKAGVYPQFPIFYFGREPGRATVETDLAFTRVMLDTPDVLRLLGEIDRQVVAHRRDAEHRWLLQEREGYLYYRDGRPVGYGYIGRRNGPFALLDPGDYPAVLAHAETRAAEAGEDHIGMEVPMINRAAVDYLLGRGFQMEPFMAMMMSDRPFGHFEKYIVNSPPFFM